MRRWITKEELDLQKKLSCDVGIAATFFGIASIQALKGDAIPPLGLLFAGVFWLVVCLCRIKRLVKEFPIE